MNKDIEFSLFEFGNIDPVKNIYPIDVLNWIFEYAKLADNLNFKRLWLAEHYHPHFAWFSPQMLLPLLASVTEKIKIGQAGVILNFHSPLTTSQNFRQLSAFFPNRIDLGIAYGKVNNDTSKLLFNKNEETNNDFWESQLNSLFKLIKNEPFEKDSYFNKVLIPPVNSSPPEFWFLGSSAYKQALKYKGNLCISYFHNPKEIENKNILRNFKTEFKNIYGSEPKTSIGIKAFCSSDKELIKEQLNNHKKEEDNRKIKIPFIIGSQTECYDQIKELQKSDTFDEIILINQIPDFDIKINNLKNFDKLIN
jgi:alkanesulfonate monooxygenase SsuD/methylene tetrahydromethanopterin reductase-like flavin-dependent oxidoreductase (luciferase family)